MVKRNLVGPSLRILDTSWYIPLMKRDGKKEFAQTHIPGASHFDIDDCSDRSSRLDHTLPSEEHFSDYVGNLGINNNSHVVVYDASDFGAFTCTRVWWMFRLYGHPQVSVLNGGFRAWLKEGHPVTDQYIKPQPVKFHAKMNRDWVKSFEDMTENIDTKRFQVVDARSYAKFLGKEGVGSGHIPGSKCLPFYDFLDEEGMMLSAEGLKSVFQKAQLDLSKPLCGTCGSGVTACHIALAAHICGAPEATLYDGSWDEWFSKAPKEHIATGVASKL